MFVSSAFFVVARSVGERWRVGKQMRCSSQRNAGDQVAAGLAGFLALCGFAWTGFRSVAGLILSGRPALAEGSGSGALKNARQGADSSALCRIMQTVTRSTSGISGPHSRNASGEHACCSSGVYARPAVGSIETENAVASSSADWKFLNRTADMDPPKTFMRELWVNAGGLASRRCEAAGSQPPIRPLKR
jgi:hypothetical protein